MDAEQKPAPSDKAAVELDVAFGLLVHGISWGAASGSLDLPYGVKLESAAVSKLRPLYERTCTEHGIDDGEPLSFDVAVVFSDARLFFDPMRPESTVARFLDLLTLVVGVPVPMARGLWSPDLEFSDSVGTEIVLNTYESALERRTGPWPTLDNAALADVSRIWPVVSQLPWARLLNALMFFHHAWRSARSEQIILNLGVCLEALLAPHSAGETNHQLAFNVAHRRKQYQNVRSFYGARSAIVHGAQLESAKLAEAAVQGFAIARSLLLRALSSTETSLMFDDENRRREMLKDFMFPG
jgi:hypothetical protein